MSSRVCAEPGCPKLIPQGTRDGRCDEHRRAKDRERGTSSERGYDAAHQAERRLWVGLVATGNVKCWRCHEHISSDEPWDLGHDDEDRGKWRGPEHQRCNRAAPRTKRT